MARWPNGVRTVQFLVDRGRLGAFVSSDLTGLVTAQVHRATLRLNATAVAALENGDVDGAYAAASDAYRMTAEALLARQGLRDRQRWLAYVRRRRGVGTVRRRGRGTRQAGFRAARAYASFGAISTRPAQAPGSEPRPARTQIQPSEDRAVRGY